MKGGAAGAVFFVVFAGGKWYYDRMNRLNYDKLMTEMTQKAEDGASVLLHCCCAPCASSCIERLAERLKVTALFYNPNIEDGEYMRRKAELIRYIGETGLADIMDCDHDTSEFYSAVKGLENCPEGGARCEKCFRLRLEKTAELAEKYNYTYFTTTLTVSPLKDADLINRIGESLGAKWLYSDFKKRNGYLRSCKLSQKYGLYRQNYCGCVFSARDAQTLEKTDKA